MVRGTRKFKCPRCGKIFTAMDIEYNATVFSGPMPCPECGAQSAPLGMNRLYKKKSVRNT